MTDETWQAWTVRDNDGTWRLLRSVRHGTTYRELDGSAFTGLTDHAALALLQLLESPAFHPGRLR